MLNSVDPKIVLDIFGSTKKRRKKLIFMDFNSCLGGME